MFHSSQSRFRFLDVHTWGIELLQVQPSEDMERMTTRRTTFTRQGRYVFACVVVASLLSVVARAYAHRPVVGAFRASVPVTDERITGHPAVAPLLAQLSANPHICGLSAAALQVYERVVVVRSSSGGALLPLVNPHFEAFERSRWEDIEETSWLCNPPVSRVRSRAHSGRVTFRIPGAYEAVKLTGSDAHCLQHLISELNGEWWCPPAHTIWPQPLFDPVTNSS